MFTKRRFGNTEQKAQIGVEIFGDTKPTEQL